jgi:hypothetical protein
MCSSEKVMDEVNHNKRAGVEATNWLSDMRARAWERRSTPLLSPDRCSNIGGENGAQAVAVEHVAQRHDIQQRRKNKFNTVTNAAVHK